jgi:GrpB-like predicted nucleotidyltransferase (UPF0157 family)
MAGTFRLMHYNPEWAQEFEQARSMLLWATEGWLSEVQHIGSTAVPDGIAQPVIDMVAGLKDMQGLNDAATLIEGLNYTRVASPDWCAQELTAFLQKPRVGDITHTVLLVRHGGVTWRRTLEIRQLLQQNLVDWQQFQNLKRDHFTSSCDAAKRYSTAKSAFFKQLEQNL